MNAALNGHVLGVLMLDTAFPRPPGDIGNPASFDCPVLFRTLRGASVARVVSGESLPASLAGQVLAEAQALVAHGATIITTSCGFLSPLQQELQASLPVPVITSALWMLPHLRKQHGPEATLAILTFDAAKLSPHHIPDPGPHVVEGLASGCHLREVIERDLPDLDSQRAEHDVASAAGRIIEHPLPVTAVVLECTNLPPYRQKIAEICGCPVVDIHDAIKTFALCR